MSALHPITSFLNSDSILSITCRYLGPIEDIARFATVIPEQKEKGSLYALLKLVGNLNPLRYHNQTELLLPCEVLKIFKEVVPSLISTEERPLNALETWLRKLSAKTLQHATTLRQLFTEYVKNEQTQTNILICALRLRISPSCVGSDKAYTLTLSEYNAYAIRPEEKTAIKNAQTLDTRLKTMQRIYRRIASYRQQETEDFLSQHNWRDLQTKADVQIHHFHTRKILLESVYPKIAFIEQELTRLGKAVKFDTIGIRSLCNIRTFISTIKKIVHDISKTRTNFLLDKVWLQIENLETRAFRATIPHLKSGSILESVFRDLTHIRQGLIVLEKTIPDLTVDVKPIQNKIDTSSSDILELIDHINNIIPLNLSHVQAALEAVRNRNRSLATQRRLLEFRHAITRMHQALDDLEKTGPVFAANRSSLDKILQSISTARQRVNDLRKINTHPSIYEMRIEVQNLCRRANQYQARIRADARKTHTKLVGLKRYA